MDAGQTTGQPLPFSRFIAIDQFGDADRWEELIPEDPAPGTVEQCADVVTFLASARASHISGTTLTVDGGASAR